MSARAHHRSRDEVETLLARMDVVEPLVNAVCTVHPDALEQADRLDRDAADGRSRGPLHGRPRSSIMHGASPPCRRPAP